MTSNPSLTLGYLVPEFPSQTHAFFWREVQALRRLGVHVVMVSTRHPASGLCRHAFAAAAAAETHYLFPPRWWGAATHLVRHPAHAFMAARYLLGLSETPLYRRVASLALLLPAAELCVFSRQVGIGHLHVHSCANSAHVAALSLLLGGSGYSLTLHGDLPVYGRDHRQKTERASFVACVTKPLQQQLCGLTGMPVSRVPVHWMGVDTSRFRDQRRRLPAKGELHIVTVARLNSAKGHQYGLQALRLVLDRGLTARYYIAGEGPNRRSIEDEVARLRLQAHVRLLGEQSEDQVLSLLLGADVFLLPSTGAGEAAPVSVMEAMACGLPVVCTRIGGTTDMIDDGEDGYLVEQKDPSAIADRLITLAHDLPLRERIGRAARTRAARDFDCHSLAGRFLELIRASRVPARSVCIPTSGHS